MKYGQTFRAQSVPGWALYNIDYNELKRRIKIYTSKDQAQAIAIPGEVDTRLQEFERLFYNQLVNEHDRADLFVNSKSEEISRRLRYCQSNLHKLLVHCENRNGRISPKKRERFAKYDSQITRCGQDIASLQRYIEAQRTAIRKILKKYQKWTGSRALTEEFNDDILRGPKSFTQKDLNPLLSQYNNLITALRNTSPFQSEVTTPTSTLSQSRRPSVQIQTQQIQNTYWNEYDNGSEAEEEPYTIYIDPDADRTYPGAELMAYLISRARGPIEKVKFWLSPTSSPKERTSLLGNGADQCYFTQHTNTTETSLEDGDASSNDFPSGYATHYATFPSVSDRRLLRDNEHILSNITLLCFAASLILLFIAGILVATGRHRLRVEVDAGVITGGVFSLLFALWGLWVMLYRKEPISWLYRICAGVTFVGVCILNGMMLLLVVENPKL
ncbi:hypothetical protein B7494_g1485 [Chlorociboria aeruginascens]|nr:hypothetical protein B7494_g1485 [Chlorociboria aeruginascens]